MNQLVDHEVLQHAHDVMDAARKRTDVPLDVRQALAKASGRLQFWLDLPPSILPDRRFAEDLSR